MQVDDVSDHRHNNRDQLVPAERLRQFSRAIVGLLHDVKDQIEFLLPFPWQRNGFLNCLNGTEDEGKQLQNGEEFVQVVRSPFLKVVGRPSHPGLR